jgi:hypothetical protein
METEEELSNCCGADRWYDEIDICSQCKEHAEFVCEEEDEEYTKLRSKKMSDWWAEYKFNHKSI